MPILQLDVILNDDYEDGIDWPQLVELWDNVKTDNIKSEAIVSEMFSVMKKSSLAKEKQSRMVLLPLLSIMETCILNCGYKFQEAVFKKYHPLRELDMAIQRCELVSAREKFLSLIQYWEDMFFERSEFLGLHQLHRELRDKGEEFPMRDMTFLSVLRQEFMEHEPTSPNAYQMRTVEDLERDLKQTEVNFKFLQECVTYGNQHTLSPDNLQFVHQLRQTCEKMLTKLHSLTRQILARCVATEATVSCLSDAFVNRILDLTRTAEEVMTFSKKFLENWPLTVTPPAASIIPPKLWQPFSSVEDMYLAQEEASEFSDGIQHHLNKRRSSQFSLQQLSQPRNSIDILSQKIVEDSSPDHCQRRSSAFSWSRETKFLSRPSINADLGSQYQHDIL